LYLIPTLAVSLVLGSYAYPGLSGLPSFVPRAFTKLAFLAYALKYLTDFLWLLLLAPLAMSLVAPEHASKAIGISWLLVYGTQVLAAPLGGWLYQQGWGVGIFGLLFLLNGVILGLILCSRSFFAPEQGG
jgi:hypothetical protein